MSDTREETARRSFTRRTVFKAVGLLPFLGNSRRGVAGTARAAGAGTRPLSGDDGATGRHVEAVAFDGETALVGVPPSPERPTAGHATVIERSGGEWRRRARLTPDGDSGQFGRAVSVDGETAVVGAELGPDPTGRHAGSAAVFARNGRGWTREATLTDPGFDGVDRFGAAVDVADGTVIVGAPGATSDSGRRAGAAAVYARDGGEWTRQATLGPESAAVTAFGRAVALDGGTALVGARRGGTAADEGVVSVFGRSGGSWRRQAELSPRGDDRDDAFGTALAVDDGTAAVGAPRETNGRGINAGAVYVFGGRRGVWRRQRVLRDGDGGPNRRFGSSAALNRATLVVGSGAAGALAFARTGESWRRTTRLQADTVTSGTAVALGGPRVVLCGDGPAACANLRTGALRELQP